MLNNLLRGLFGLGLTAETKSQKQDEERSDIDCATLPTKQFPSLDDDVRILEEEYGALTQGKVIEVGLHRLLELCPRSRKKSDAYLGLKRRLKEDWGVELIILSKTKRDA